MLFKEEKSSLAIYCYNYTYNPTQHSSFCFLEEFKAEKHFIITRKITHKAHVTYNQRNKNDRVYTIARKEASQVVERDCLVKRYDNFWHGVPRNHPNDIGYERNGLYVVIRVLHRFDQVKQASVLVAVIFRFGLEGVLGSQQTYPFSIPTLSCSWQRTIVSGVYI